MGDDGDGTAGMVQHRLRDGTDVGAGTRPPCSVPDDDRGGSGRGPYQFPPRPPLDDRLGDGDIGELPAPGTQGGDEGVLLLGEQRRPEPRNEPVGGGLKTWTARRGAPQRWTASKANATSSSQG